MPAPNPASILIREPRLAVPGQKPVGPVRLDPTHPLTLDIQYYNLCTGPNDFGVFPSRPTKLGDGARTIGGSPEKYGDGVYFLNTSSEYISIAGTTDYGSWDVSTLFAVGVRTDAAASNVLLGIADSGVNNRYMTLSFPSAGDFYFGHRSGSSDADVFSTRGGTTTVGKTHTICGVSRAADDHECWGDGQLVDTNTNTQSPSEVDTVSVGAMLDSSPGYGKGVVKFVCFWRGRALTPEEIRSLHADPYQMFIPA